MEDGIVEVDDNKVDLFKYVFLPRLSPPTLAVVGCLQGWGALNPVFEIQCRWATRVFKVSKIVCIASCDHTFQQAQYVGPIMI